MACLFVADEAAEVAVWVQEEGYEEALKCDGTDLDGQQLRVQKCMSAGQHGAKKKQAPIPADATAPGQQQQQVQQQPAAPKVICAVSVVVWRSVRLLLVVGVCSEGWW